MSYATGEALLLTRVQACTNFSSTNAVSAKWDVLNSGKSAFYAILRAGKSTLAWTTLAQYIITWRCVVEVWQHYEDDGTTAASLYGHVGNLLGVLTYPHLGGGMDDSTIEEIGECEEMWTKGGGPAWLRQTITVAWQEETNVTFNE